MLFHRVVENGKTTISYGSNVKISALEREKITIECLRNMSFFAAKERTNIVLPEIDAAKDWMEDHFMPMISPKTTMFEYAEKEVASNPELKTHLLEFLKNADFNISNVSTKEVKEQIPEKYMKLFLDNDDIAESEKEKLRKTVHLHISRPCLSMWSQMETRLRNSQFHANLNPWEHYEHSELKRPFSTPCKKNRYCP